MWSTFVLAVLASLAYAAVITWGLGRRRFGATAIASAVYVFMIVVFATWAIASWVGPRGPIAWDAPWLMIVVVGALVALVVLATATERRAARGALPLGTADRPGSPVPTVALGFGFGSLFWLVIVGLLVVSLIGIASTDRAPERPATAVPAANR